MLSLISVIVSDTPWWKLLLSDLPHDAAGIVGYLMVAAFVVAIWIGHRKRSS